MLVVSLALLIATGFPVKLASMPWALSVTRLFGGFERMLAIHYAAAVLLALLTIYYLAAVAVALFRRKLDFSIVPRLEDFRQFGQHFGYLIGLRKEAPKFGQFTWWEKFEFWAVVWGTIIMGLSGLTLAFPEYAATYVPRWVIGVFRVAHSNEALLAFLAVVVGHVFAVHLSPHAFPGSRVWLNGRLSLAQLHEDHAMLYDVVAGELPPAPTGMKPSPWVKDRTLIIVELALYVVVLGVIYATVIPYVLR